MGLRAPDNNSNHKIGDTLVHLGFLTSEALSLALAKVRPDGPRLGEILVNEGTITEHQLAIGLSHQFNLPFVDLDAVHATGEALNCIPEKTAREKLILPIVLEGKVLTIAVYDPSVIITMQSTTWKKKYDLNYKICAKGQLLNALNHYYKKGDPVKAIVHELMAKGGVKEKTPATNSTKPNLILHKGLDNKDSASIEILVDKLIENAINNLASDIHIEPDEEFVRIRERVDGILQEVSSVPLELGPALISRIKILANLDFAEKRNSQDGRFRVTMGKRSVDIRISTLPTVRGEKVVMRILDKEAFKVDIENVGFSKPQLEKVKKIIDSPFGIVFVTGPTGSGKSTTVYSMLGKLNTLEKNVITIEDPVEYQFNIINQVQVQPKIGFTFANILRGILRQDPDIIMVGEIRDKETADIAIRASLTGHLVITTLHTNNAQSTITRLIDMGIEPTLLSGSLLGVVSQRLVRTLCEHCKKKGKIAELDLVRIASSRLTAETEVYHPVGCHKCRHTGYKGRTPIFEILVPSTEVRKAIVSGTPDISLSEVLAKNSEFETMREDGIDKILAGVTTPSEILRATLVED